jgi:hypothetical protein
MAAKMRAGEERGEEREERGEGKGEAGLVPSPFGRGLG